MRNEGTNMVVRVGVGRRWPRVIAPARADPFDAANNLRADRQQRWLLPGFFLPGFEFDSVLHSRFNGLSCGCFAQFV